MRLTYFRRLGVSLAAAALAVSGLVLTAGPAAAATVDPSQTGTLAIHKFEQPTVARAAADGLPQDTTGLDPLSGIEFQVRQVPGIDLTTNDGWLDAQSMTPATAQAAAAGVTPQTGSTDLAGDLTFSGLPLGLYLVTEHLDAAQVAAGITGIEPFLVTLPLTHPVDRDEWLYTVHVYPKNNVDTITKTVSDASAVGLGDEVVWTIDAGIPAGGVTDLFRIVDTLDARLAHVSTAVALVDAGAATLLPEDYTTTHAAGIVTVELTSAGLTKLDAVKQASAGARVRTTITTTVSAVGDGTIVNAATLFPNSASVATGGVPADPAETQWANLTIRKVDAEDNAVVLEGAEFQLFTTLADARARTNPIDVAGTATWTTDAAGLVTIEGLRSSDFEDGAPLSPVREYFLVETKAPSGYQLLAEPVALAVTEADQVVDVTVENPSKGFDLPLTGSTGTIAFTVVGLGLISLAVVLLARSRRSSSAS